MPTRQVHVAHPSVDGTLSPLLYHVPCRWHRRLGQSHFSSSDILSSALLNCYKKNIMTDKFFISSANEKKIKNLFSSRYLLL